MQLDLTNLLSRAWKITWTNKALWILGVLAALGSGGGGSNFNFNFPGGSSGGGGGGGGGGGDFPNLPPEFERFLSQLAENGSTILFIVLGLFCALLLLNLVFLALSLLGEGGLIGGARQADAQGTVTFSEAWGHGTHNLGRLFMVWLITGLPPLLLGLVIVGVLLVALFGAVSAGGDEQTIITAVIGSLICIVPLACIIAPVSIALRILNQMGNFAAVLEEVSGLEAIKRGWTVLKDNFVSWLVLGGILWVLNGIYGFVVSLPILLAVIPAVVSIAGGVMSESTELVTGGVIFALVCCVAYTPVLLVLRGVFTTWTTTIWTLAYQQLNGPAMPSAPMSSTQI